MALVRLFLWHRSAWGEILTSINPPLSNSPSILLQLGVKTFSTLQQTRMLIGCTNIANGSFDHVIPQLRFFRRREKGSYLSFGILGEFVEEVFKD